MNHLDIPFFIIAYNQYTYVRDMVNQIVRLGGRNINVIDNASTFVPLLDYYDNEYKYNLIRMEKNYGHLVFEEKEVEAQMGSVYFITDPDLLFNRNLPYNYTQVLYDISVEKEARKVGFAINIQGEQMRDEFKGGTEWERQFWNNPEKSDLYPALEMYNAPIDTTFTLVNRNFDGRWRWIRVAGDFTCEHRPWLKGFGEELAEGEYEAVRTNNISTHDFRKD